MAVQGTLGRHSRKRAQFEEIEVGPRGSTFVLTGAELSALDGVATTATIALAASGTTDGMAITITMRNAAGATVAAVHEFEWWFSDAATGIGLTADAFSGNVTATTGAIHTAVTAKKHFLAATAATGIFVGLVVDSANPADVYVAMKKPLGSGVVVSAISGTNWEGA